MMGIWVAMTPPILAIWSRSLTGLQYWLTVLSGCLRCSGTHPTLWVNTRPSMRVLVSTMLVESAYFPRYLLVGLGVYRLPIFNAALLHLSIEGGTVEAHIRARWSFDGAVVEMVAGNRALAPSCTMTQLVRNCAFFCKMPSHCAILASA